MRSVDVFIVARKRDDDPLVAARRELLARHGIADKPVIEVRDPERDRDWTTTGSRAGYERAVRDWHEARAEAFEEVLLEHGGDVGFLVWGDPAFYDSTIRIVDRIARRGRALFDVEVLPGISALQVLAARHQIVLHDVGGPIHVTTGRRLREAVEQGENNILVMLDGDLACERLDDDWSIWWGANLGTEDEALVQGGLADVLDGIRRNRAIVRKNAGWVMDTYLLRRAAPEKSDFR